MPSKALGAGDAGSLGKQEARKAAPGQQDLANATEKLSLQSQWRTSAPSWGSAPHPPTVGRLLGTDEAA